MTLDLLTTKQLEARLAELEQAYNDEEGSPAEVYARIVGYYRSVRNWNIGKRQEFNEREHFGIEASCSDGCTLSSVASPMLPVEVA